MSYKTAADLYTQSALLNIPREVRDEIISFVLWSRHATPTSPEEAETQNRTLLKTEFNDGPYYLLEKAAYRSNAMPLLMANKQLHAETKDAIRRLDIPLELDLKFVNDRFVAPTWTLIAPKSQKFKRLRVVCDITGQWEEPKSKATYGRHNIWQKRTHGPADFVWIFYSVLMHFLHYGPAPPTNSTDPKSFFVECLELDFVDPERSDKLSAHGPDDGISKLRESLAATPRSKFQCAKWLMSDLAQELMHLLSMKHLTAQYGQYLHGSIGSIIFKLNGQTKLDVDVGHLLANLGFLFSFGNIRRDQRVHAWITWKEEALALRKQRGLHTVQPKEGWQEATRSLWAR